MSDQRATSDTEWGGNHFGWFGSFVGAFTEADKFQKFTDSDREALARIAAEHVQVILARGCDSRYLPGPDQGQLWCELHLGHNGKHRASEKGSSRAVGQVDTDE